MVTSLNSGTSAREAGYEMYQYIAARLNIVTAGSNNSVKVGTLPQGAVIIGVDTRIVTPFAGGTPVVTLGISSGASNLVATLNSLTAGGEHLQPLTTLAQPLTADVDIWANAAGTATAGDSYVIVNYIKPIT